MRGAVDGWFVDATEPSVRANVLGAEAASQLTVPGVPDVYQGCEVVDLSLVDPDNRRPVDFDRPRPSGSTGSTPASRPRDLDDEKLLVTSRALRLRRDRPEAFVGPDADYARCPPRASTRSPSPAATPASRGRHRRDPARRPLLASGSAAGATRTVALPDGRWRDVLDRPRAWRGGVSRVAPTLLAGPARSALLVRAEADA